MSGRDFEPVAPGSSRSPYRTAVESVRAGEFVYAPRNKSGRDHGLLVLYRLVSLPVMLTTGAGWLGGSAGAMAGLLGSVGYVLWTWRARKRVQGAILRVADDELTVVVREPHIAHESLQLSELADVTLDLKTIERVIDGDSAIPATKLVNPKVGPRLDTARLVLVAASGREVRLADEYLPHFEATDWLGRVRVFLRKHGWVPEDEREVGTVGVDEE
jgi:hypothetical protein